MKSTLVWTWVGVFLAGAWGPVVAADPAMPAVSTFAPAADLVGQVDYYVDRLEKAVENEAEYADAAGKINKDANTLILIALALGLHDTANKYHAAAPGLIRAAQAVAAAKDYAAAKAAVAALKSALASQGSTASLKWEKLASLEALMEQVPLVNSRLKRNLRRFEARADQNAGDAAVLAVIAHGSMANVGETKKPDQAEKWFAYCVQMRSAAAAVNAAIRNKDKAACDKAMKDLNQSCEDCHAVFHPEGTTITEEDEK